MRDGRRPIFYDPDGKRARITNVVLGSAFFALAGGLLVLLVAFVAPPLLPPVAATDQVEFRIHVTDASVTPERVLEQPLDKLHVRSPTAGALRAKRFAYYSSDDRSFESLKRTAQHLEGLLTDWLLIGSSDGEVRPAFPSREKEANGFLKVSAPHVAVFPILSSRLPPMQTASALTAPAARMRLAQGISRHVREHGYAGVVVSLPELPPSAHTSLVAFLEELGRLIRPASGQLLISVDVGLDANRYRDLERIADYLLVDAFDMTWDRSGPGPLASQAWFESVLARQKLKARDRGKTIFGIGSYAIAWSSSEAPRHISVTEAWRTLEHSRSDVELDPKSLNTGYQFIDAQGRRHDVWMLDAVSTFNHMRAALAWQPGGLALWRLGNEDPGVWSFFARGRVPDEASFPALREPQPGQDLTLASYGIATTVEARPTPGIRSLKFDPRLGLITQATLQLAPTSVRLSTWDAGLDKAIALTFDDGPDARYTAPILDTLREKGVKATFFITGLNATRNPHLLRQIYADGHDIGNHTFTHSDMVRHSSTEIEMELNATTRVVESQLGVRTILFRPSYYHENYGIKPDEVRVVETAARLGYLTVGVSADPNDWMLTNKSARIAETTIRKIVEGGGRVVLLHDSGGDRTPTIEALPLIIETLQKQGYRFVTIHELLGKTRSEVMPSTGGRSVSDVALAQVTYFGMRGFGWVTHWLPAVAIGAALLGAVRLLAIVICALRHKRIEQERAGIAWKPASLAVLVPAYNEEKVICRTIESLLRSHDKSFDIVVIDDGSTDDTAGVLRRTFGGNPRVKVFRRSNGGKSAALNFGVLQTEAEIVVAIDADTVLSDRAIPLLVRHFRDPRVGAVAGSAVVGNPVTLMTRFQALEYMTSQNLERRAFELFNAIGVVPGAIGAWRRAALIEAGGYSCDTLAEDADLTVTIERNGWKVVCEPCAEAYTEAPETFSAFLKQRFRWMLGTLQVAFKHFAALRTATPRGVGLITLPNIFVFQFGFALLAPLMDILLAITLTVELRAWLLQPGGEGSGTLGLLAGYWVLFQFIDVATAAVGLWLDPRPNWRLLPLVLLQRVCYRQLLSWIAIRTLLAAVKGHFVGWGKLLRTGNVGVTT
jgi:peptidoglycan/xylan/chitin deacetylase (PgdA/CDA1 family)/GT2 family glycosyltransferase